MVKVKVEIKVGKKTIVLEEQEARQLFNKLNDVFGKENNKHCIYPFYWGYPSWTYTDGGVLDCNGTESGNNELIITSNACLCY